MKGILTRQNNDVINTNSVKTRQICKIVGLSQHKNKVIIVLLQEKHGKNNGKKINLKAFSRYFTNTSP